MAAQLPNSPLPVAARTAPAVLTCSVAASLRGQGRIMAARSTYTQQTCSSARSPPAPLAVPACLMTEGPCVFPSMRAASGMPIVRRRPFPLTRRRPEAHHALFELYSSCSALTILLRSLAPRIAHGLHSTAHSSPAADQRESAQRGYRPEPPLAGENEGIETSGECKRSDGEEPAGGGGSTRKRSEA